MSGGATIDFTSLQHILDVVGQRGRRAMTELAPAIAESMAALVLEEFETEGHGKWPGFAWQRTGVFGPAQKPSTKGKSGRRWRGNPKLLQDTGNLIGSITPAWDALVAEVYTNVPYAKYHVSPEPRTIMPLRDFFDFDRDAFEGDVADMLLLRLDRDVAA
jgi:phage gpG-like protein